MPEEDTHEAKLRDCARAYAAALLAGDEVEAELAIRTAMRGRVTTAEINAEIIAPAMWLIGELWARDEISIGVEHIATEISLRILALQGEALRTARGRRRQRVLLAAAQGEQHVLALKMAANLLAGAGYETVMLGADVPVASLAEAAVTHEAGAVCLSATMAGGMDKLLIAIGEVHNARPGCGVVLGGRALSSRVRGLPGVDVCERVQDVVDAVDALVKRAHTN